MLTCIEKKRFPTRNLFFRNHWVRLILHGSHARILQHICPFSCCSTMTVLQMLPEMIRPEELFGLVALSKFVFSFQVLSPYLQIRRTRKLLATIPTDIKKPWALCRMMKCGFLSYQSSTRPRVLSQVQRILVTLRFVFVLEPVGAEIARELFFRFVCPGKNEVNIRKIR